MAAFLSNLPSFNKDNFSRFQPSSNKYQRKQTYMTLNKDFPEDEQLIVNQRCNLIIQYLERQSKERLQFEAEKGKKRDINEVVKKRAQSSDTSCEFNSKLIKKRRISSSNGTIVNTNITSNTDHQISSSSFQSNNSTFSSQSSSSSYDDLIEIDDISLTACNLKIN